MISQLRDDLLPGNSAPPAANPGGSQRGFPRKLMSGLSVVAIATAIFAPSVFAAPIEILFVGNSYTFGRVDPVMSYNAANVHDLTAGFNAIDPTGTNSFPKPGQTGYDPTKGWFEPHPWGGVPGIFKKMTVEAGLDYEVSLSTRNAATLRGQFLNTANPSWDLRGNVASKIWNTVVLQAQSDEPLPTGKGKNANPLAFTTYANQFEKFIHTGTVAGTPVGNTVQYTETQLYGSLAACQSTGQSASQCGTTRTITKNANFSAATKVYLEQTWARPDMVEAHKITTPDKTTANGAPIIDTSAAGGNAILYYSNLAGMTTDMHTAFFNLAASNPGYTGVIPVGDAFQRAVDEGLVHGSGFYLADGTYVEPTDGTINLWWFDRTHASMYGSYLSALTTFGSITGLDPRTLGAGEQAAFDLGISVGAAQMLQLVAAEQLGFAAAVPEPASVFLLLTGLGMLGFVARRRAA